MPSTPLISVITPVRNGMDYVSTCLTSVQNVRFSSAEHIICDGGSSDGTAAFAQSFSPTTQTTVTAVVKEDRSMTEGLNNAISLARGEWIMPLNIDDQYLPGVGAQIESFLSNSNSDLVTFDVIIRAKNRLKFVQRPWLCNHPLSWDILGCYVAECGVAMRRETLLSIGGYNLDYDLAADYHLYKELSTVGSAKYSGVCIGLFNEDGGNLSHTLKDKILAESAKISRFGNLYAYAQKSRIDKLLRFGLGIQSYTL